MLRFLTITCAAALAFATHANAASVTWNFSGTINTILTGSPLDGTFSFGQSASGQITLDTGTTDDDGDASIGLYSGAVTSINVTIGGYSASATGGDVYVQNDFPEDALSLAGAVNTGIYDGNAAVSGASVGGLSLGIIALNFLDFSAFNPLSSDAFPALSDLNAFANTDRYGYLGFQDAAGAEETIAAFTLESLTLNGNQGVPAPGALALLGLGLFGLGLKRRTA